MPLDVALAEPIVGICRRIVKLNPQANQLYLTVEENNALSLQYQLLAEYNEIHYGIPSDDFTHPYCHELQAILDNFVTTLREILARLGDKSATAKTVGVALPASAAATMGMQADATPPKAERPPEARAMLTQDVAVTSQNAGAKILTPRSDAHAKQKDRVTQPPQKNPPPGLEPGAKIAQTAEDSVDVIVTFKVNSQINVALQAEPPKTIGTLERRALLGLALFTSENDSSVTVHTPEFVSKTYGRNTHVTHDWGEIRKRLINLKITVKREAKGVYVISGFKAIIDKDATKEKIENHLKKYFIAPKLDRVLPEIPLATEQG